MKSDGGKHHCVEDPGLARVKTDQQFDHKENCDVASWWTGRCKLC